MEPAEATPSSVAVAESAEAILPFQQHENRGSFFPSSFRYCEKGKQNRGEGEKRNGSKINRKEQRRERTAGECRQ
jgi:hypothetical protein